MIKTVDQFLDDEYRNYAEDVAYGRALPSLIDGMKPVRRKIFYYMTRNKNAGFIRVSSIAGGLAEKCNYHHGESSAQKAIVNMAKDFPSSNNLPMLEPKGAFGSKLLPKSAAEARYIHAKYNKINDFIFLDTNLAPANDDLESPEPKFFLPIIPMFLVNGVSGIGIGYAVKIFPRKIDDIIAAIENCLNKNELSNIKPYFKGCKYDITEVSKSSFNISGKYSMNNDKIVITELIPGVDRNKFVASLINLQDKEIIKKYSDETKQDFKFIITPNKPIANIYGTFDISKTFHENYTLLDENNDIKIFNDVTEIIRYFVNYRLAVYTERKTHIVKEFYSNIEKLEAILCFIKHIKNVMTSQSEQEIRELFQDKISSENIDYCLKRPLHSFLKMNIDKINEDISYNNQQIVYYNNVSEHELYLSDLSKLKQELGNVK